MTPAKHPAVFAPVLERLRADASAHFGAKSVHLAPVSYEDRPFSHVLRVAVQPGRDAAVLSHLFVKIYKPKTDQDLRIRVASEFEANKRVHAAMERHEDLRAVPPVACYPEHWALVTEEVQGPTLLHDLTAPGAWLPTESVAVRLSNTMNTVGRWIRLFQSIDPAGDPLTVQGLREYMDIRLKRLVGHPGSKFTEADRQRVLDHIERLGAHVAAEELRTVGVHGDLALGNILVSEGRVVVLDFAMTKPNGQLLDLSRLFLQVEMLGTKPYMRTSLLRRLQDALLHGFDPSMTVDRPFFRLYLLLHRINHLGTLTMRPAPWPQRLYNGVVSGRHRRALEAEVRSQVVG